MTKRVTTNASSGDGKYGLAPTMKLVIALVFSLTVALLNMTERPAPKPAELHVNQTASAQAPVKVDPKPAPKAQAVQPKPFDANDPTTWPTCAADEFVRADNGQCAKKPTMLASENVTTTGGSKSARVPVGVHDIGGSGNCAAEIAKYNWGQATALAVARAESGHVPGVINNNPNTLDYSVGCFQINIYGANAASRPPQEQLIDAAVNVAYAHKLYTGNGSSFIGQWGVCRSKVSCY